MNSMNGYTDKQLKFINYLIDQIGYNNSTLKQEYLNVLLRYCVDIKSTSNIIEDLLKEKELLKKPKKKTRTYSHIAVTDISDFVFCPASFAIKQTYILPKTEEMEEGEELHEKKFLEEFLKNVLRKRENEFDKSRQSDKERLIYRGSYGDLLKSKIIFEGHSKETEPFFSPQKNLAGVPDYIFQREDGSKFTVEEKHTWQEIINKPWESHIAQVLGYVYGLSDIGLTMGYLIYFSWSKDSIYRTQNTRLYPVHKNSSNKKFIIENFKKAESLKQTGEIGFDLSSLNAYKCFKCSSKIYCKHKSGRYKIIKIPYD